MIKSKSSVNTMDIPQINTFPEVAVINSHYYPWVVNWVEIDIYPEVKMEMYLLLLPLGIYLLLGMEFSVSRFAKKLFIRKFKGNFLEHMCMIANEYEK